MQMENTQYTNQMSDYKNDGSLDFPQNNSQSSPLQNIQQENTNQNSLFQSQQIQGNTNMVLERQEFNSEDIHKEQKKTEIEQQNDTPNKSKSTEYQKESAYIVISVFKQHQYANKKTYILQNDKIVGSTLPQKNQIQIIRRRKQQSAGESNIDLGLASNEPTADKVPATINTELGFRFARVPTKEIIQFLALKRPNQPLSHIPFNVIKLIHSFLKPQPKLFIQDCGTSLKTFVRVQKDKPKVMNEMNNYLIGSDFYFHIIQQNKPFVEKPKKQKLTEAEATEYFYQTLVRENEKYRCQIHGLNTEESAIFNRYLEEYRQLKKKGRKQYNLQYCNRPFLKIQFDTPHLKSCVTFIAKFGEEKQFKIGRSQDCDIIVNLNTVSRKQTQILFSNNQWMIRDGEGPRGSANGTWQALQQYEFPLIVKQEKQSVPLQIEDQMEIKISENIFKFDFVNFGVHKRRKLNNELYQELTNFN